jgi:hypothetical protein
MANAERSEGQKHVLVESAGNRRKKIADMDLTGLSLGPKTSESAKKEYEERKARRLVRREAAKSSSGKKGKKGKK